MIHLKENLPWIHSCRGRGEEGGGEGRGGGERGEEDEEEERNGLEENEEVKEWKGAWRKRGKAEAGEGSAAPMGVQWADQY